MPEKTDKKMFKVLNAVTRNNKTFWNRLGTAFLNKDNSINVYLDSFPKDFQLQIREYDESDFKARTKLGDHLDGGADHALDAPMERAALPAATSHTATPF